MQLNNITNSIFLKISLLVTPRSIFYSVMSEVMYRNHRTFAI